MALSASAYLRKKPQQSISAVKQSIIERSTSRRSIGGSSRSMGLCWSSIVPDGTGEAFGAVTQDFVLGYSQTSASRTRVRGLPLRDSRLRTRTCGLALAMLGQTPIGELFPRQNE